MEQTEVTDERLADDCTDDSRGSYRGVSVHLDGLTAYDVLWNERYKAIANLRKLSERGNVWGRELVVALGLPVNATNDDMCDRLIHLIGGNRPSGIDVLRAMDDGHSRTCPESSGEVSENAPSVSITDELREWASDRHCKGMSHTDVLNIGLIADRIDAQFDRICQQQEAVLQSTIERMADENLTAKDECDHWKREASELRARLDAITEAVKRIKSLGQE